MHRIWTTDYADYTDEVKEEKNVFHALYPWHPRNPWLKCTVVAAFAAANAETN